MTLVVVTPQVASRALIFFGTPTYWSLRVDELHFPLRTGSEAFEAPQYSLTWVLMPGPPKVCRIMAFGAVSGGFGLLFYILLGSRYGFFFGLMSHAAGQTRARRP